MMSEQTERKPDIFMPLYIGKWTVSTQHLDADTVGAYVLLCVHYWDKGGPIKAGENDQRLRTVARIKSQDWNRVRGMLSEFFRVDEKTGLWHHDFLDGLLEAQTQKMNTTTEKARKGAKTRWDLERVLESLTFPDSLESDAGFMTLWRQWVGARMKHKKPKTGWSTMFDKQLVQLAQWGVDGAIASINSSLMNGYQGIFEPRKTLRNANTNQRTHVSGNVGTTNVGRGKALAEAAARKLSRAV